MNDKFCTAIAIAQILLPQGGDKDDMTKAIAIALRMMETIPAIDLAWLIAKSLELLEETAEPSSK